MVLIFEKFYDNPINSLNIVNMTNIYYCKDEVMLKMKSGHIFDYLKTNLGKS